ncbi:MAG: hypothetical protein KIT31_19345 [Deltaproteobacteria bacterium]|nr:hypothetical protein [Deltaproteobacteria bacterium]
MRSGVAAAIVAVTPACAQVFGLDETAKDPEIGVSLSMVRRSIGATVVTAPEDLSGRVATYLVPDEADPTGLARVVADQPAADMWVADIKRAPVQFDLPDFPEPVARQLDFPSQAIVGLHSVLEHPNPTPGDPEALLTVSVTLDAPYAGEGLQLFTLGSWNVRGLEAPPLGELTVAPAPFTFGSMASLTGRPHEALTTDDAVLALRHVGNVLTGVAEIPAFAQTGNDTLTGTMVPVAADQLLDVVVDQAEVATRYTAVRPAMGNLGMQWALHAAPGHASGEDRGPVLHAAGVGLVDPPGIQVSYGNPFAAAKDWRTVLTWFTQETRSFTPAAQGLPVTLFAQMFEKHEPSPALALKLPAGLPELISIGDLPLSIDGLAIPAPARAVTASFVVSPAANTLYQLQVLDLVPNAAETALELKVVYSTAGGAPRFTLPPEVFVPGHSYTLRAISVAGGHPGLADGDLSQRQLPVAVAFMDSGVFTVMP